MFSGCSSLEVLNLSNFGDKEEIEIKSIFYGCSSLKNLICSNELVKNAFNQ